MNTKTDGPPWVSRCHGMKAPRERGRPARTSLGTAFAISSTRFDRQRRQGPASAGPWRFPPAGRPAAASQENRAATQGTACGRDARAPGGCRPDGAVESVRRATSLKADGRPLGKPRLPASPAPAPRRGRSIEKDHQVNIDAQDAQDNQGGRLLHERMTPAMIACGFADVQE